jgi:hypothetical protein
VSRSEVWGLRLLLAGLSLGFGLMLFVVALGNSSFYQTFIAPDRTGVMRPLGFVLNSGILVAFAMTLAGIACFPTSPSAAEAPVSERAPQGRFRPASAPRRGGRRRLRRSRPPAPHGST